ncbi:hypothetical protein Tco_1244373 [Tanacetum coccineum]
MDSIIPLGQKNTLAEYMILFGADNRPPMLDKDLEWSDQNKKYAELSVAEKIQADCDMNATNIILQGTSLTKQERECKLYNAFDKFTHIKGETLHKYYLIFTQLINDMNIYNMKIELFQVNTKFLNSLPPEWSFVVPVFSPGDYPIACLNKAMDFLTTVAYSRFPSTNNQLRTSSNLRNQAAIQDGRVTVQQVNGTSRKRPRNASWFKDKAMLAEAHEAGQILDKEQLDLDAYDSDCDDVSNAKSVLMANISNYGSDIILEDFEHILVVDFSNNEIHSESNIIMYSQYLQETQQAVVQDTNFSREKMIDSQMDDMIKEKLALKEQVDSLERNLFKQIKEKESLLQTFTVFKNESREKESKYMENEIDLEKKIKELDNIVYKVGQSAQTVHMLTKPQVFYDNAHKQALGYQNPFYLKKSQPIKPTLYDGSVISSKHAAMPVIDDDEKLILEEVKSIKNACKTKRSNFQRK